MLIIEVRSIDKLHAILTELNVITYLQCLVAEHAVQTNLYIDTFGDAVSSAQSQLLDWQTDALVRLRDLVHNQDFVHPALNNADSSASI